MLRPARILIVLAALTAAGLSVAYAASLGVSSQRLAAAERKVSHATCTLTPVADAYTSESQATTSFGGAAWLAVSGTTGARRHAFLRFDLGACSFPAGSAVDAAKLTLDVVAAPSSSRTFKLWRAGASWSESTIRWSNQPASGPSVTSTTVAPGATSTSFPVTADVIAYLAGTANHGWQITDANATSSSIVGVYWSDEGATKPQLTVDYAS
jgi:hypothetical protein